MTPEAELEFLKWYDNEFNELEILRKSKIYFDKWEDFLNQIIIKIKEFSINELLNFSYHLISSGAAHLLMRLALFELAMRGGLIKDYQIGISQDESNGLLTISIEQIIE